MNRKLSVIAGIITAGLIIFTGCAVKTGSDFIVNAEGTPEGILVSFNNIPEDTYALMISFCDANAVEKENGGMVSNIYIWEDDLTELKETGNLLCPFVKEGVEYKIMVSVITNEDYDNDFENPNFEVYSANAVANGGIYLTNSPSLNFTDNNTTVTLSEMPVFSEEVTFVPDGPLRFNNFVIMETGESYGGGWSHWNDLIYPARETLSETQEHFGFKGDFPVNASVSSCLIYDDKEWSVVIANAEEKAIMSF